MMQHPNRISIIKRFILKRQIGNVCFNNFHVRKVFAELFCRKNSITNVNCKHDFCAKIRCQKSMPSIATTGIKHYFLPEKLFLNRNYPVKKLMFILCKKTRELVPFISKKSF